MILTWFAICLERAPESQHQLCLECNCLNFYHSDTSSFESMWVAGDLSLAFPFFPPILDSALRTECFSRNSHLPALKYSLSPLSSFSSTPLWFCHLCSFSCDKQRKRLNIQILLTRAKIYLFFTDVDSFNICRQPSFSKLVVASFSLLNHCVDGPTPTCWGLEIMWVHIKVLRR